MSSVTTTSTPVSTLATSLVGLPALDSFPRKNMPRQYEEPRSGISADIRRSVEVESGHCCAIKGCGEHTYLEIHHIDQNRENNKLENLILLCDKHHKMAHADKIDRKALRLYKTSLSESYSSRIDERFDRLEEMFAQSGRTSPETKVQSANVEEVSSNLLKQAPDRADILSFVLKHVAIRHLETILEVPFEHQVTFVRGEDSLTLDGLIQDDEIEADFIIEVQYLRKSYADAPVYGKWLENKVELYELLTGRKARGILLVVVGRERMKEPDGLMLTRKGIEECNRKIELEVFSCSDIGFDPGPVSMGLSQLKRRDRIKNQSNAQVDVSSATRSVATALLHKYLQGGVDQPATAPDSKPEGIEKPKSESDGCTQ